MTTEEAKQNAISQLNDPELQEMELSDAHSACDGLMMEFLRNLGHGDVVDLYYEVRNNL